MAPATQRWFPCLVVVLVACGLDIPNTLSASDASGPAVECPISAPPSMEPPIDVCRSGTLILASERVERVRGRPTAIEIPFLAAGLTPGCVRVISGGDDGRHRVSSALVGLDGDRLIGPDRFSQNVTTVEQPVTIAPGDHRLAVVVRGRPGSFLDVSVVAGIGTPRTGLVRSEHLEVFNLYAQPSYFRPPAATTLLSAQGTVLRFAGLPSGSSEHQVRWAFEVVRSESCELVKLLPGEADIVLTSPSTFSASARWDGRNDAGGALSDGTYGYRLVAALFAVKENGEELVDQITTAYQPVVVDTGPPQVWIRSPDFLSGVGSPLGQPAPRRLQLPAGSPLSHELVLVTQDASGSLVNVEVRAHGGDVPVNATGSMRTATLQLASGAEDYFTLTQLFITATDVAGNVTRLSTELELASVFHPRRFVVRLEPTAAGNLEDVIATAYGARVVMRDVAERTTKWELPRGSSPIDVVNDLAGRAGIVYALPDVPPMPTRSIEIPPRDPIWARLDLAPFRWHLQNLGAPQEMYIPCNAQDATSCREGLTCRPLYCATFNTASASPLTSVVQFDCCECATDAHCGLDYRCVGTPEGNRCLKEAVMGADIGWIDAADTLMDIARRDDPALIAVIESGGVPDLLHRDLRQSLFVNERECCVSPPCPDIDADGVPECTPGELGMPACTQDSDCGPGGRCLNVPRLGFCADGFLDAGGLTCERDEDCGALWTCDTSEGECRSLPFKSSILQYPCFTDSECSDMIPNDGKCAVLLSVSRCTDGMPGLPGVDDDGDGFADMDDPDVQSLSERLLRNGRDDDGDCVFDSNRDGYPCGPGDEGVDEPDEARLVAWDDDENGVIDDVHGADFGAGALLGELYATTIPERAPYVGAMADFHPTAVASVATARVHNHLDLSGVHPSARLLGVGAAETTLHETVFRYAAGFRPDVVNISFGDPYARQPGETESAFLAELEGHRQRNARMSDPNVLYAVAADNLATDYNRSPLDRFSFDGFVDARLPQYVTVANSWIDDTLFRSSGRGALAVDLAAPGTAYFQLAPGNALTFLGGTSFAAPVVAGVAAVVISAFPSELRHHPLATRRRLLERGEPVEALINLTAFDGRVDLARAVADPRPVPALFANESFRLNDREQLVTNGASFIVNAVSGPTPEIYAIEVFDGLTPVKRAPRIYRVAYGTTGTPPAPDSRSIRFFDESATRLPAGLTGSYAGVAPIDVEQDGCQDFVLAAFFEARPGGLEVGRQRLLRQRKSGTSCLGTWFDDLTLPARREITRDVVVLDVEDDGDQDVLLIGDNFSQVDAATGSQLLLNDGSGAFSDVTATHLSLIGQTLVENVPTAAAVCDLNLDGFPDVAMATSGPLPRILMSIPAASPVNRMLVEPTAVVGLIPVSNFLTSVACADLTGDGYPDILFGQSSGTRLYVNKGDGTFQVSGIVPPTLGHTEALAVCNLSMVGSAEIIIGTGDLDSGRLENSMLLTQSLPGVYSEAEQSVFGFDFSVARSRTTAISCLDMDGDGRHDVVWLGNWGLRNSLYVRQ